MSKRVWIKADKGSWEERRNRITTALESGADYVLVNEEDTRKVRELGKMNVAAFYRDGNSDADVLVVGKNSEGDGTNPLPKDFSGSRDLNLAHQLKEKGHQVAAYVVIKDKDYEEFAAELGTICDYVIMVATDWKIIPLENLIAALQEEPAQIVTGVRSVDEARVAFETLETGADAVLLDSSNPNEIKATSSLVEAEEGALPLQPARITRVKEIGMGDRVCVDTVSLMQRGQGMLVGNQANGLFLIHSESEESPYVASRPFRVNAGAVHAYMMVGDKTQYLSELSAGDDVTIVDYKGHVRPSIVGRVKIERRPLMLIEAEVDGNLVSTIAQNAETIKLVTPEGTPVAVTEVKEGDKVLVYYEDVARHFGMKVEETILEK